MDGATLIVKMLEAYGVRYVFGVPGETSIPLYGALGASDGSIEHVMARDERSAGYMADAYARVTNRPGVVEFPSGAGPLYGIAAVAESNESSVPVIAISSDNPLHFEGRGFIAGLDCTQLFKPVVKESIHLKSADRIPETIRRAFRIATTGRPGAVHITIPENIYHEDVNLEDVSLHIESACRACPAYPTRASSDDIVELRELISAAYRPLVVAGAGVNRSGGRVELTKFAERFRVPVVTTMTGQQSIPDNHELSIGIVGDNGFHPHANRAMEEADLILYVGCRIGSVVSMVWTFPAPREDRKIVQVDIDPEILGRNTDNTMSIVADAKQLFDDLVLDLDSVSGSNDPDWVPTLNKWRQVFWDSSESKAAELAKSDELHPQTVIAALNERLGAERFVYSDPGTSTPFLCRFLRLPDERSRLILNRAFGGLGYAIPAVVGGWYAHPGIRPIGLFGDGSLGMSAGELETIVRLKIPAILLHFNNSGFGWIDAHKKTGRQENSISLQFSGMDCAAMASAFGLRGLSAKSPAELDDALNDAFSHDGPVFIDVKVQSIAEEIPAVYSWLKKSGVDPLLVDGKRLEIDTPHEELKSTA